MTVYDCIREVLPETAFYARAYVPHDLGVAPEVIPVVRAVGLVLLRQDPLRRALKQHEPSGARGQRRDDLHGARTRAEDTDASSIERHLVIPARTMKGRTAEGRKTGDVRE